MNYEVKHTPMVLTSYRKFTFEDVESLYEGRGDSCRCGCAGNYYYPDNNKRKILNTIERMTNGLYDVKSIDNRIFEIELEVFETGRTRVQTLYLKK